MEALVRKVPEVIRGSLNTQATNKKLAERNGRKGWVVEGFDADPETSSFDLVTKAGAGGRVRSVLEALYDDRNAPDGHTTGEPMSQTEILEALKSEDGKRTIAEIVAESVSAGVTAALAETLPAALQQERQNIQESVREEIGGAHRLRTLAAEAKGIIEAAKGLPESAKTQLLARYGVTVADDDSVAASPSLSVIEAVLDGQGTVTKSATDVLKERVEADIEDFRTVIREASPTVPISRAGGTHAVAAGSGQRFGGEGSGWADRVRKRGMDPAIFGAPKPQAATTTTSD
jgi:hypothetical protein